MAVNIIITHKGNPSHLKYVLDQAVFTNPKANVVLMGDESNQSYTFVKHVFLKDYFKSADEFAKVYKHMNATSIDYELFCYQRWFCVYEYMVKHNLNEAFAMDSDVLIFDDLEALQEKLKPYAGAFGIDKTIDKTPGHWVAGPPLGYVTQETLKNLLDFFTHSYQSKKYLNLFKQKMDYHQGRNEPYGICDMTQIYFFTQENKNRIFNLFDIFEIQGQKTRIDETILDTRFFCEENHRKKLTFTHNGKECYAYEKNTNEMVRFPLVHFQGYCPINAKLWIPDYYIGKRYRLNRRLNQMKVKAHQIKKMISDRIYLWKNCRVDKNNIILLPEKKRFIKKLKITVKGQNNRIDLSQIGKIRSRSSIHVNGNDNVVLIGPETRIKGKIDIVIQGGGSTLQMGKAVQIDDYLSCFLAGDNSIYIGDYTTFFKTCIQSIHAGTSIQIGKDCMFSYDTWLYNSDGHPIYDETQKIVNKPGDMKIGDHVWVSWGACILKGVSIPDGCIVGRSAVVSKSVNRRGVVIAGNPAKVCKELTGSWKRDDVNFLKKDMP